MSLTPEQRVREAEATLRLDRLREVNVPRRVIAFDRYEAKAYSILDSHTE